MVCLGIICHGQDRVSQRRNRIPSPSHETVDTVPSAPCIEEVQVQHLCRKSNQNALALFICMFPPLSLTSLKGHMSILFNVLLTKMLRTALFSYLLAILMELFTFHASAVFLLRDFHALWVHAGLPVGLAANDTGFFSLCGPTQFPNLNHHLHMSSITTSKAFE